jgi:hypothetical protein
MKLTAEFKFIKVLAYAFLISLPLEASFEPLPVGGRAAGMGEAYTAVVDDVFSLYYNPAGVMQLNRPEIGSYYSQLYNGLSDNSSISRTYLGYGQPIGKSGRKGGIGVSYLALQLPGLYKEETFGVTYGREYRRLCNYGISLKWLRKEIGTDDYTTNAIDPVTGSSTGSLDLFLSKGNSATGIGLDLGLQYRLTPAYAFGFSARNINSPDLGLNNSKDSAPAVLTAALARRLRAGSLDVEIMNWKTAENNLRLSIGGEKWFKSGFGLRAGGGVGSRNYSSLSFGASYKMESFQLDYATVYPLQGIEGTLGIQQISLIVRMGKPPIDPLEKQLIKEKEDRIRAEAEAMNAKAERDRLKKQLIELTAAKTQAELELEKRSAEKALQDAQGQEKNIKQTEETQQKVTQTRNVFNEYTTALTNYNNAVSQGAGLSEKRRLLEKIYTDFNKKGVDLSTINRELKNLKEEESKAKKDFDLSMNFYQRLVQQGASKEERRGMLERIIQKYKGTGIDIKSAEEEIKSLR